MKTFKIAAAAVLFLWLAWINWRIEQTRELTTHVCGLVYADIEAWNMKNRTKPPEHPSACPFVDLAAHP